MKEKIEKKRVFKILARATKNEVSTLAGKVKEKNEIVLIKEPNKTLTMIKMKEPVKNTRFYIGEIMVSECVISLNGIKGMAVTMGDDLEKILDMAIVDAAINADVFEDLVLLLALEKEQQIEIEKENAMHLKTMVNFNTMDRGK